MRLRSGARDTSVIVGIFQSERSLRPVLASLRRLGSVRFGVARIDEEGRFLRAVWARPNLWHIVAAVAIGAAASAAVFDAWSVAAVTTFAFAAIVGLLLALVIDESVVYSRLRAYRQIVLRGESLVTVSMPASKLPAVAKILTVAGRERPSVFVLQDVDLRSGAEAVIRKSVAMSDEAACSLACELAAEMKGVRTGLPRKGLRRNLQRSERKIKGVHDRLSRAVRIDQGVALSAEWLLDNAYVIQGHIEEYRSNLPESYYRQLPRLVSGPWAGYPRIYAIACELVSHWDAHLTRNTIQTFLQAYQSETILTSGELWALPMMVRLRLIEHLASLSTAVERRQAESEEAALWANRLLNAARRQPERLQGMTDAVARAVPTPSAHFVEELIGHLHDELSAQAAAEHWLRPLFDRPLVEVIHHDNAREAEEQVSLANAISTLRLLSQMDWRDVFESVSHLEAALWADPSRAYSEMDFLTRDRYRHIVEQISRRARTTEEAVALAAIDLARRAEHDPQTHIGYYLLDEGRPALERAVKARRSVRDVARRWIARNAALVYIGSIEIVKVALILGGLFAFGVTELGAFAILLAIALLLLPVSEIAVQLVNFLIVRCLEPRPLPKMSFEEGIPDEHRTLVVVPMMLLTPESIHAEVERLEVRALANPDPNLRYCLLADYSDAVAERMPEDLELLDVGARAIEDLNRRHDGLDFLLLHRERKWSKCEGCWIGWERKRGKLEDLNRLLLGEEGAEEDVHIAAGRREALDGVRLVLTLDADTQLPRDTARMLVAALAHPLNRPHVSEDGERVLRGYTIIQPRVSTSLPSATASLFTRLFTDPTGTDPYTRAVSDVYQDLAGEASYHGKGIYDLAAFHRVLGGRFPDSHILSHDLLEGAHARVGLASDIELLDQFPQDYSRYASRLHRWTRGDWQIVDWLFRRVPQKDKGHRRNTLGGLDRWKIFDNLRRSLVPIGLLAALLVGCAVPGLAWLSFAVAVVLVFAALGLTLIGRLTEPWKINSMVVDEPARNFLRSVLFAAVLPHQAAVSTDAIVRALYRRAKRRLLLEWSTARRGKEPPPELRSRRTFVRMLWVPAFAVVATLVVAVINPAGVALLAPFAFLWFVSPFVIFLLERAYEGRREYGLSAVDRADLRVLARQTWRYFDDFVGQSTHWLPPDNYQDSPRAEVAERTSPTNIGLYMLSIVAANDFGYETTDQTLKRLSQTLGTIKQLERYRGNIYNWYETRELTPLGDKYVSMVDSTNLLACFWVLGQALDDLRDGPVVDRRVFDGLSDTFRLFLQSTEGPTIAKRTVERIERLLTDPPARLEESIERLRRLCARIDRLDKEFAKAEDPPGSARYWIDKLTTQSRAWTQVVEGCLGWVRVLSSPPKGGMLHLGPHAHGHRRQALTKAPSLRSLAFGDVPGLAELLATNLREARRDIPDDLIEWFDKLQSEASNARAYAREMLFRADAVSIDLKRLDSEMELGFLYDKERRLFAIGFNLAEQRLDRSYYDLLASEARIGSFLAIARGEVPTDHWWALGRPYGRSPLRRLLLSWNGTMFEYLLPLIFMRSYANSLLDQACRAAIEAQVSYGRAHKIPWGISESAFSALDARHVYQYRAFGVPELALRRTHAEELVVAPYASALALMLAPRTAATNLRRLSIGKSALRGDYGFYDSIDYSRERGPHGERGVVVQAFMAHHQGMVLLAVDNALNSNVIQRRFHADPRVEATLPLLHERVPVAPPVVQSHSLEAPVTRIAPTVAAPIKGRLDTPSPPVPRAHLLSNGSYKVMVTTAGGGYSRWKEFDITRWRADTTTDKWGSFLFFKDTESGHVWSVPHQPVGATPKEFEATYSVDKATFRRQDRGIESQMDIVVSPEDAAEVRIVSLINRTMKTRTIEVTSYMELALAPHDADRSHPAFNKLFVKTEMVPDLEALVAWRRPRAPHDPPIYAAHIMPMQSPSGEAFSYETDRAAFIGRGHDAHDPVGLHGELKGGQGHVLDPAFCIRRTVDLGSGDRVQFALVTVAAETRESVEATVAKYREWDAVERAVHMAWSYAQLELRHLRIRPMDAQLYLQIASNVLYPNRRLRASSERIVSNTLGQSSLWPLGISGDLPIVVVTIASEDHLSVVQEALTAHDYWRVRGLACDLVILNQEQSGYENPLQHRIERLVASRAVHTGVDRPGGVFVVRSDQVTPDESTLLLAAARIFFVAARGSLSQQVAAPPQLPVHRRRTARSREPSHEVPIGLRKNELVHHNGFGGFTPDGREYVVQCAEGEATPRPWSNVMANPDFGALVTDEGSGCVWSGNSQANRLVGWSNDPVSNPASHATYVYDPESDALWTPTALPIRERGEYRARHAQGYTVFEHNSHGIEQELTVFVAAEEPLFVQRLHLTNRSAHRRRLVLTHFAEWVLGTDREATQPHIATRWDDEAACLFARNAFNADFGSWIAFAACTRTLDSYTADRTEFIGRNGSLRNPTGARRRGLSQTVGGGLDPCSALQVVVELRPGESTEVSFTIGQAQTTEEARRLVERFRSSGYVDDALERVREFWNRTLTAVQIKTPEPELDLLFNRWLLYQNLSCRIWGRAAFYQSGGAYGFRDQLQDVLAMLYSAPEIARNHIVRAAARQFVEGDVQHWWHAQSGAGVRTRISDDLLWLPYVVAQYVRVTGDKAILTEDVPFLSARPLSPDEHENYAVPAVAGESGTLIEHCRRAIERGVTSGPHGLPLIGAGDWNDGLSNVGADGRGESVWLAWFCIHALVDFAELLEASGRADEAEEHRNRARGIADAIEREAWDGEWYRRGYFDDGSPLGSRESQEAQIDSLPQSWSVISSVGDTHRSLEGMRAVDNRLVDKEHGVVRLFTPPFDASPQEPGYIKSYPPGVRENGGQYTHASLWAAMAWARLGDGDQAVRLLRMMNPMSHSADRWRAERYMVEPYVVAADVYTLPDRYGMGGWTWYTGSAGWMYRVILEEVLGFRLRGSQLTFNPSVPSDWSGFEVRFRFGRSEYTVEVDMAGTTRVASDAQRREKPTRTAVLGAVRAEAQAHTLEIDGIDQPAGAITLIDDGKPHTVRLVIGSR